MKRDLFFKKPLMNAAGTLGFAADTRLPLDWHEMGAFLTNPISLRRRIPAARPVCIEYAGGLLLHSGLPNPGFEAVLRRYASQWARSELPVIVHLMADRPEETRKMVQVLENMENVMAVELGFAPLLSDDILLLCVEICQGELPLVVSVPAAGLPRLGASLVERGASALSLAAPRGALSLPGRQDLVHGRIYGPSLFPQSLDAVQAASKSGLPVIGAGGAWDAGHTRLMLDAGALAVQLDFTLWLPKNKTPVD
jgi:dihydroorotate dehydrogenase (NAD+) catalytic subunit